MPLHELNQQLNQQLPCISPQRAHQPPVTPEGVVKDKGRMRAGVLKHKGVRDKLGMVCY